MSFGPPCMICMQFEFTNLELHWGCGSYQALQLWSIQRQLLTKQSKEAVADTIRHTPCFWKAAKLLHATSKCFFANLVRLVPMNFMRHQTRQVKLWSADRGGPSPATSRLSVSCLKLSRSASKSLNVFSPPYILDTHGTVTALTHLTSWLWARSYQLLTQQHELWQKSVTKVLSQAQTRQHWMWQIVTIQQVWLNMAEYGCTMLHITWSLLYFIHLYSTYWTE